MSHALHNLSQLVGPKKRLIKEVYTRTSKPLARNITSLFVNLFSKNAT